MAKKEEEAPSLSVEMDLANEQIIVASILHDAKLRESLVKKIPADYFADEQHAKVWDAIKTIQRGGLKFDIPALHKQLGGAVSHDYLKQLVETYPTPAANIGNHIEMLEWDHAKLTAIEGPLTQLLKALQANESQARVKALTRNVAKAFEVNTGLKYMLNPKHLASTATQAIRDRMNAGHHEFGIKELDYFDDGTVRMVPGLEPGGTTLITGLPGSGKSTVAARIALEQARMQKRVLYGAWEMQPKPTISLMASFARQWDREKVVLGKMSESELLKHEETCERIGEYVRFFNAPHSDAPDRRYQNEGALDILYQNIADSGASVVILDLWERMIPNADPERERRALFTQQAIAQETGVHCILLCQQKAKVVEATRDKRPSRDTILGSSAWVDIADTILGVHRPGLWRPGIEDDILEIFVLKQRWGKWPIAIEFDWNGETGMISNGRDKEFEYASAIEQDDWLGGGGGKKRK